MSDVKRYYLCENGTESEFGSPQLVCSNHIIKLEGGGDWFVLTSDHDRVVADLMADIQYNADFIKIYEQTIAEQAKVIEKLKEQRDNLAHDAAYEINYGPHPKEALEKIKELDAELTALTKQPEPKEGV